MKNLSFIRRVGFALAGIKNTFRRESSFRFQILAACLLLVFCLVQRPPAVWCALFAIISALVLALELFNTAIEAILDKLHPEHDAQIGFAKDCLAGAVLVASFAAVVILGIYLLEVFAIL